jgi:hypothetical protein
MEVLSQKEEKWLAKFTNPALDKFAFLGILAYLLLIALNVYMGLQFKNLNPIWSRDYFWVAGCFSIMLVYFISIMFLRKKILSIIRKLRN